MIRERERQVMNGAVVLAAGVAGLFATVAWFIYAIRTRQAGTCRRQRPAAAGQHHGARGSLHRRPQRGAGAAAVRRLRRHRPDARTALGEPALHQAQGLDPRPQLRVGQAQGQRHRRQPDRDCRGRGVARRRHGRSRLRGGRLQQLRARAERVGAAQPGDQLRLRRARRSGIAARLDQPRSPST